MLQDVDKKFHHNIKFHDTLKLFNLLKIEFKLKAINII